MRFGCPTEIITDRGTNFTSGLVKEYVKRIGANHKLTSAFHPRTNSKVERYNGVIKQMLRKYVNGAIHRWDEFVNAALWASRIRIHSTTGFSPFYLVYGREPKLPGDILQPYATSGLADDVTLANLSQPSLDMLQQHRAIADTRLRSVGEYDKQVWDAKIKPVSFVPGALVMLTHEGKFGLEPRFKGPYIVTNSFPEYGTYQLQTVTGEQLKSLVHVDRLKPAKGDTPISPWYDPTASRREIREANRQLAEETTNTTTRTPDISQLPPLVVEQMHTDVDTTATNNQVQDTAPITSPVLPSSTLPQKSSGPILPSMQPNSNGLLPLPIPASTIKAVNQIRRSKNLPELPVPVRPLASSNQSTSPPVSFSDQNQPLPDFIDPVVEALPSSSTQQSTPETLPVKSFTATNEIVEPPTPLPDDDDATISDTAETSQHNEMDTNEPMVDCTL